MSLVTLAVADLDRSTAFYCGGLGWEPGFRNEEITFFQLNGIVLALFRRDLFAEELGVAEDEVGAGGVALAYNVRNEGEVDEVIALARDSGGRVVVEPHETDWGGYSGYFTDPDGHQWEVAWNPAWPIGDDGDVRLAP